MIKKSLLVLAVLIGALVLYAAFFAPKEQTITRSVVINASPEALFPYINHSKKCYDWMPWQQQDPSTVMTYSGPEEGVGAVASWSSKGQMGTGKSEVIESISNHSVKTQLTYTKPFKMEQVSTMTLAPVQGGTKVTWSVSGHLHFACRVICVVMNPEKMVGSAFEKGLNTLKTKIETPH